jgi:hypothetical protein
MLKGMRIILCVVGGFLTITLLHLWLNIGFDQLGLTRGGKKETAFRVGFLPVT